MALPELIEPPDLPAWQADPHSIDLVPVYADVPTRTGHGRRRRVYTTAPRFVNVARELSNEQMAAFDAWFENILEAGVQTFATQVANQGPGLLWWAARFAKSDGAGPYTATAVDAGCWKVTARLLLTGTGSVDGPPVTGASANVVIALQGAVTVAPITATAGADIVVALAMVNAASADIVIALATYVPEYELREDGGAELREDGGRELRG